MGHREDFIETIRAWFWPILDFFGIGATGMSPNSEHVDTIDMGVEDFERVLHEMDVLRNAPAKYKRTEDGRKSVGSWRVTGRTHPDLIEDGMQLHITLFPPKDGSLTDAVDVHAHYEDNYGSDPIGHLDGDDYSAVGGVIRARILLNEYIEE